jgi:hypothetical protein
MHKLIQGRRVNPKPTEIDHNQQLSEKNIELAAQRKAELEIKPDSNYLSKILNLHKS